MKESIQKLKRLKFFSWLVMFFILPYQSFGAISYNFAATSAVFVANSAPTTIWTTNADDLLSSAINIGFTFNFGGCTSTAFTQVKISTNGWMALGTGATGSQSSNNMSWSSYGPLLAPLWDDLKTGSAGASINYKTTGSVGNRVFTVEWLKMKWGWSAGSEGISFQVKLYEADGKIEYIYAQDAGALTSPSASIGINGGSAGDYYSLNATSASPNAIYGTATNNLNSKPATGQKYVWTPSVPMTFVGSSVFQANTSDAYAGTSNNQIIGVQVDVNGGCLPFNLTQMVINMTGTTSVSDVSNIDVYYTGNSSTFTVSTLFGSVASGTGSLTVNGSQTLLSGSNYFWIVYDLSTSATVGNLLDAECTQITMDSGVGNQTPSGNPPTGNRPIALAPPSFSKWIELGWAKSVIQSSDGNLVWAGRTNNTYSTGSSDAYIVKTSTDLSIVHWTAVIGTVATEYLERIVETNDGFVAVGSSNQAGGAGSYDLFITKVNLSGIEQWSRTIGTTGTDYGYGITNTSDGNIAITGSFDDGGTDRDGIFVKIQNSDGAVLLQRGIDISAATCNLYSIIQTSDGGFLLGGCRGNNTDFAIIKLKSDYSYDWGHYWGGASGECIKFLIENAANDYTVGGYSYSYGSGSSDGYLMRITVTGGIPTVSWVNAYGGSGRDTYNHGVRKTDGSYAMTGITTRAADPLNDEAYITSVTSAGEVNFIKSVGTPIASEDQEGYGIADLSDGSFAMAGLHNNAIGPNFYLMRVSSSGYSCSSIQDNGNKTPLSNPAFTSTGSVSVLGLATAIQSMTTGTGGVIVADGCNTNSVALPIELISFNGIALENFNQLYWSTASEHNNDYFTVERSIDGVNWNNIGIVEGAGNSNETRYYSLDDYLPLRGINYYKLKQTDFDGKSKYSEIIALQTFTDPNLVFGKLYPNPSDGTFSFSYKLEKSSHELSITIENALGEIVERKDYSSLGKSGIITIVKKDLKSGVYFIRIEQGENESIQKLVISTWH